MRGDAAALTASPAPGAWLAAVDLDLVSDAAAARLAGWCTPAERARAHRLPTPVLRRRRLVARGWLRGTLGAVLSASPGDLPLQHHAGHKPHLSAGTADGVDFSLSHSGGLAVLAVGRDVAVGVDVEHVDPGLDADAVARHFFAPPEAAALQRLPPAGRLSAFYRSWCRKEALLKARGTGLGGPLHALRGPCAQTLLPTPVPWPGEGAWQVVDLPAGVLRRAGGRADDTVVAALVTAVHHG